MAIARTFAWYPNGTSEEFGALDHGTALGKFDTFPWDRYLREAEELDREGVDCVDADLTFRIDDCHFMARIKKGGQSFEVEAWVRPAKKLFGIFGAAKCREFSELSKSDTRQALDAFLTQGAQAQHDFFRRLRDRTRKK